MGSPVAAIRFNMEPERSLGFASISASYSGVGTALNNPLRQFFIQNLTNVTLKFSFNGIDDHFTLAANGFWMNDITTNKTRPDGFFIAEGNRLYVKQDTGAPTSGSVFFSTIYAAE